MLYNMGMHLETAMLYNMGMHLETLLAQINPLLLRHKQILLLESLSFCLNSDSLN